MKPDCAAAFFRLPKVLRKSRGRKSRGRTPKTLGISRFSAFDGSTRQLRRTSEGAGAARRLFDGADTTGEIRFTSVWFQRKQKRRILFTFGMSCPRDHRKRQSERSPARSVSLNFVTKWSDLFVTKYSNYNLICHLVTTIGIM